MADRYSETERLGVNAVESIFLKTFKWIFREQPIIDMGIDAHIETVDSKGPTGKLIGVQIKTGPSHFYETDDFYTFYLDNTHYNYWINHSLPVLLIGHLPDSETTFWQYIDKSTVEETKKGWKVGIPKTNLLNQTKTKFRILEILSSKSIDEKINKLFFDKELMKFIENGDKINIYTEEWHNKSLGRGQFSVILIKDGKEEVVREWKHFYNLKLQDHIAKLFPWADFENDKEFYAENFEDSVYMIYSKDWLHTFKIYPYKVVSGEAGLYRLNLKLNKTGKAFLALEEYLEEL
ncbi:DUF4365 domain-containing protein [Salinimicrobium oceani]|uniref:DUF4365 domain-containing protein n=1 Tax=Salinimicrobium oceani TaxID=2722702 RepID=A0ABX1CVY1_9FLAO|nr:DUF4365 domain-containing protein [Salinimicrobium oceani]NJW52443.1 DUF4365 domain-containing protein [Salinimicrobium oceani]